VAWRTDLLTDDGRCRSSRRVQRPLPHRCCSPSGADDYVTTPFCPCELRARIAAHSPTVARGCSAVRHRARRRLGSGLRARRPRCPSSADLGEVMASFAQFPAEVTAGAVGETSTLGGVWVKGSSR
jgi:hypothetical protein